MHILNLEQLKATALAGGDTGESPCGASGFRYLFRSKFLFDVGLRQGLVDDESPFTDISQPGPEAVLSASKVTAMVQVLDEIRRRAVG